MKICDICAGRRKAARIESNERIAKAIDVSVAKLEAAIEKALNDSFPAGWGTKHQGIHSHLLDVCIDANIIDFVEYVNKHICKTAYSCEGDASTKTSISLTPDQYNIWLEKVGIENIHVWAPDQGNVHLNFLQDPWGVVKR
jgi:hypothetical protein